MGNDEFKTFRGRLFGGFNRQDVADYIEKSAAARNKSETSLENLQARYDELEAERDSLLGQIEQLKSQITFETNSKEQAEKMLNEAERRSAEMIQNAKATVNALCNSYLELSESLSGSSTKLFTEIQKIFMSIERFDSISESAANDINALKISLESEEE